MILLEKYYFRFLDGLKRRDEIPRFIEVPRLRTCYRRRDKFRLSMGGGEGKHVALCFLFSFPRRNVRR